MTIESKNLIAMTLMQQISKHEDIERYYQKVQKDLEEEIRMGKIIEDAYSAFKRVERNLKEARDNIDRYTKAFQEFMEVGDLL